jgi:hypothetical protein
VLEQLNAEFGQRGLGLLGIDVDPRGIDHTSPASVEDLKNYGVRFGIDYPLLFDPARSQVTGYSIHGYPTIYAIDKAGAVAWVASGEVELDVLRQGAQKLL